MVSNTVISNMRTRRGGGTSLRGTTAQITRPRSTSTVARVLTEGGSKATAKRKPTVPNSAHPGECFHLLLLYSGTTTHAPTHLPPAAGMTGPTSFLLSSSHLSVAGRGSLSYHQVTTQWFSRTRGAYTHTQAQHASPPINQHCQLPPPTASVCVPPAASHIHGCPPSPRGTLCLSPYLLALLLLLDFKREG